MTHDEAGTETRLPVGWYMSPDGDTVQRWWNGSSWTTLTRPMTDPVGVPTQRTDLTRPVAAELASQIFASQLRPAAPRGPGASTLHDPAVPEPGPADTATIVSGRLGQLWGDLSPGARRAIRVGPFGQLVIGLVVLLFGLIFAVALTSDDHTQADESSTVGRVVDHAIRVDSDGRTTCSPIATFQAGAAPYQADSLTSSQRCPDVGASVRVVYTTATPGDGHARVESTNPFVGLVWLVPLAGLVLALVALRSLGEVARSIRDLLPSLRP